MRSSPEWPAVSDEAPGTCCGRRIFAAGTVGFEGRDRVETEEENMTHVMSRMIFAGGSGVAAPKLGQAHGNDGDGWF